MTVKAEPGDVLENADILRQAQACQRQSDSLGRRLHELQAQLELLQRPDTTEDVDKSIRAMQREHQDVLAEIDELELDYDRVRRDALACCDLPPRTAR